ncbi:MULTISPECIES: hypothetical protein [unclassified Streptomyces]|uniref:hypothetical protein n=1 Tax=unclassified Streptomyces TaxID=2593676 RepID=UPI0038679CD2|nr:hypothetical protein OG331_05865 [Streptomyces sp. NBC_01017]
MRVWHALRVERIDAKIAALQRRQAEEERGRGNRPRPPDWIVELGIGAERTPVQVHAGDWDSCRDVHPGSRGRGRPASTCAARR